MGKALTRKVDRDREEGAELRDLHPSPNLCDTSNLSVKGLTLKLIYVQMDKFEIRQNMGFSCLI